ncbi:hypothetical protein [Myxococcus sp. RHSTA-1-4]|uniref:hypothetical protein n=1 Tax=Myxococcus sp. RHSTA-1-4 TaxID=2874601 RepID=UPI001CBF0266|nr:hypothetical protein [Myxococcus sp. RHSTA-1-4]MBZ4416619.1 hypothetical protein [Myxococcus sp. RHSTA-1-4]
MLALLVTLPFARARAVEPPVGAARCSKADVTRSRRSAEKLYRDGRYAEAVESLRRTKESCWSALDATDRGWLVSDLGLAALRAGQPELCRQVLDEAPAELDAGSRVAKAIAHNRGLCQGDGALPVTVFYSGLLISSPAEASAALTREWSYFVELREGRLAQRADREIDRCTETDGVELGDLNVMATVDLYSTQAQLLRCRALKMVTTARPSRVSHVRDLFSTKALGKVLPAALAPAIVPGDAEERSRASGEGRTWNDLDSRLRFEPIPERKEELRVRGSGVTGDLSQWALGDFNGDGVEDLILLRTVSPEGGSAVDMAAFLLTRTQPGGVLTILEQWK